MTNLLSHSRVECPICGAMNVRGVKHCWKCGFDYRLEVGEINISEEEFLELKEMEEVDETQSKEI